MKPTDYKCWDHGLKKCGYATDPRYPSKLIDLIERYQLDNLDKGVDVSYASKGDAPSKAPSGKPAHRSRNSNDDNTVTIGNMRPVELFDGRIKFVRARKGETVKDIADGSLEEGQVGYIQPKRNKNKDRESCIADKGETLWGISQRYGVKLNKLAKYNNMGIADPVRAGQKVWLRRPRK